MKNKNFYDDVIYKSKNCGEFKVVEEVPCGNRNPKERWFEIKFINTGYTTIVSYTAMRHGSVKDKLLPSVAGVGYIGYVDKVTIDPETYMLYKVWNDMINRCYNKNDPDYKYYGEKGITVDKSWHDFRVFMIDAKQLPGYENKLKYPYDYQLDKDYLQIQIPRSRRVYSRSTCLWISKNDNTMIMNRDNDCLSGYYGVMYLYGKYSVRVNGKIYGSFDTPEEAAKYFNEIYPSLVNYKNHDITILNNV